MIPRRTHEPQCFTMSGSRAWAATSQYADATKQPDCNSRPSPDNYAAFRLIGALEHCSSAAFIALCVAHEAVCCAQSSFLIFVSDCCSFAGPVLLQQLLEFLEDRSSIGECGDAVLPGPQTTVFPGYVGISAC